MSKANVPVAKGVAPRFRGIPAVDEGDPGSLWNTVKALVEIVETLTGQRGDTRNKAILLNDLLDDSTDPLKRPELEGIHNYLRADDHLKVTAPSYTEHPHKQYWHKALDTAFSRLRIASNTGPLNQGAILKPWLVGPPQPYRASADGVNGVIALTGADKWGVYAVSLALTFTGTAGVRYEFTLRINGASSTVVAGTTLGTQQTTASLAYTSLVETPTVNTVNFDWALTNASSPCTITSASFSLFRIAPLSGYLIEAGVAKLHGFTNGFTTGFQT